MSFLIGKNGIKINEDRNNDYYIPYRNIQYINQYNKCLNIYMINFNYKNIFRKQMFQVCFETKEIADKIIKEIADI